MALQPDLEMLAAHQGYSKELDRPNMGRGTSIIPSSVSKVAISMYKLTACDRFRSLSCHVQMEEAGSD